MSFPIRKAGCLLLLLLLAAPAQPMHAGLLKKLFAGFAILASWGQGLALEPPAVVPDPGPTDARPLPLVLLRPAPATVRFSHLPPCYPTMAPLELHPILDEARIHYPADLCPTPVPEHLPHEVGEPAEVEDSPELVAALATRAACDDYEEAVEADIDAMTLEAACALEAARISRRADRGELLVERLEDAVQIYERTAHTLYRARFMETALEVAIRRQEAPPAGSLPLAERLACVQRCIQDLDLETKRFLRKVHPVLMAMLPEEHGLRKKLKREYCTTTGDQWLDAPKHVRPTRDEPYDQRWVLDPPYLD